MKSDRLKDYLKYKLDSIVFIELAPGALGGRLEGVPIPVGEDDAKDFAESGLDVSSIAKTMTTVIGADPSFVYVPAYIGFLRDVFDEKLVGIICSDGVKAIEAGEPKEACISFRAALALDPDDADAMYGYARACRDVYSDSEDEMEIGCFKAESIEYFEKLTIEHPEAAEAHYYLGYGYRNMGLYIKAELAFRDYLKLVPEGGESAEVRERLAQLRDPVEIEKGCNHVIAGRYDKGISVLEKFLDTGAKTWWPLHYYLGVAYRMAGDDESAVERLKNVLRLNASHAETMDELAEIYAEAGEKDMAEKYRRKAALVRSGISDAQ